MFHSLFSISYNSPIQPSVDEIITMDIMRVQIISEGKFGSFQLSQVYAICVSFVQDKIRLTSDFWDE